MDLAILRARQMVGQADGSAVPRSVLKLLDFSRLPARALVTIVRALDSDDDFRRSVAEGLEEDQPDRCSWLFLTRPDGWADELGLMVDLAAEDNERRTLESRLADSERGLASTKEALDATRSALEASDRRLAELSAAVEDLTTAVAERDADLERLRSERERAVRNLKTTEELANARLKRIRELEAEPGSGPAVDEHGPPDGPEYAPERSDSPESADNTEHGPERSDSAEDDLERTDPHVATSPDGAGHTIDRDLLARSFHDAIEALSQLATAFGEAARSMGLSEEPTPDTEDRMDETGKRSDPVRGGPDGPVVRRRRRVNRRTPIRLRRGAVEGTPDAIGQLLGTPDVIVLVDGYNVAMEAWPTLSKGAQRDSLVQMAASVASRYPADIHLVFDGVGDGSRPNVTTALPVRVHFSDSGTEADDVILDMVASTAAPIVVVTSDRRVLDGARRLGANLVTSSQIIEFVRGRGPSREIGGQ